MRAKDIMSSPVHTLPPVASVTSAAELLAARAITAAPVVNEAGVLVGMVSEGDLLRHRVPADPTAHLKRLPAAETTGRPGTVGEVMSARPVTTRPDADVAEVAETMLRHDVRSLPVLDNGAVTGIVSRRDILRAMVRSDDVLTLEVQHRLDEYRPRSWTATVRDGVALVEGLLNDETDRTVVSVLARTVPGVAAVHFDSASPTRTA
jgi:CBS domain-containing protein